jgi:hypothetical protein
MRAVREFIVWLCCFSIFRSDQRSVFSYKLQVFLRYLKGEKSALIIIRLHIRWLLCLSNERELKFFLLAEGKANAYIIICMPFNDICWFEFFGLACSQLIFWTVGAYHIFCVNEVKKISVELKGTNGP